MSVRTIAVLVVIVGLPLLLTVGLAEAVPPGPPFNPPGPPPWRPNVKSVPIPATDFLLAGGLLALPWLASKRRK